MTTMMMRTGRISEHRAVEGAVLAIAITMLKVRVMRTRRVVRYELGEEQERRVGRGTRK